MKTQSKEDIEVAKRKKIFIEKSVRSRLEALSVVHDRKWQDHFEETQAFVKRYRKEHPESPFPATPNDPFLRNWLEKQRRIYRQKMNGEETSLTDERQEKLESLGYALRGRDEQWEGRLDQLRDFIERHDGSFPYDYDIDELHGEERKLAVWCRVQKQQYTIFKRGKKLEYTSMTEQRIAKLEALGFCWNAKEASWMKRYKELIGYHSHHGDCLVPHDYAANPSLAVWVGEQRTHYKRFKEGKPSSMTPHRFKLLRRLNFAWDAMEAKWQRRYQELKDHVEIHGFGNAPSFKDNPVLRAWLNRQHKLYKLMIEGKQTTMTPERVEALENIGFALSSD